MQQKKFYTKNYFNSRRVEMEVAYNALIGAYMNRVESAVDAVAKAF